MSAPGGGYITVQNLKDVLEALADVGDAAVRGAQIGIGRAGLAVERQAMINANNGTRSYQKRVSKKTGRPWLKVTPPRHVGQSGGGPNVVTGALKRSIRTDIVKGFGNYVAVAKVGPTVEYGRAVELGLPKWGGVKYPYLEPAAETLIKSGRLQRLFTEAVLAEIRKG